MNRLSGKNILITGATGFIGKHLVRRLLEIPEVQLILISRKLHTHPCERVKWIQTSLDQLTLSTWQTAGVEKIDFVFHLGAFIPKNFDDANNIESICRDNLWGTRRLLESLHSPPAKVVFSSTIDVYNRLPEGHILSEVSSINPSDLYGASKIFCEQLIKNYARIHNIGYAILRYGHIYGPGEEAYTKLIPQTIRVLLREESPVIYGDGSALRDFLNVEDVVEATLRSAVLDQKEIGPINIVSGKSKSIQDVVNLLVQITEFPGEIRFMPEKSAGYSLRFDNCKMREVLGAWGFVPLEEGLKREVDYFRSLCP